MLHIEVKLSWQFLFAIFIGPKSDHSLPMSLTNSLTDDLIENWMNWPRYTDYADQAEYAEYVEYAEYAEQGCISCGILVSGRRARGVSSEHMENMEMFSCSPT